MQTEDASQAPLVSFVVFAYNQEDVVGHAIEGAFAQTYPNLQLIFSDDCSPDGTFEAMRSAAEAYDGPHEIVLNRNPENVGPIGHVNRIFELSKGEMIVINAGDDISTPDRTERLFETFRRDNPLLVYSDVTKIDETGAVIGDWSFHDRVVTRGPAKAATASALCLGAACAWHPDIMRLFGEIKEMDAYGDLVFSFRAILAGRISHVPEPLLQYREGGISYWGPASVAERRARKRRRQKVHLAVCRQRLSDCLKFAPGRGNLHRILRQEIARYEPIVAAIDAEDRAAESGAAAKG